MALPEIRRMLPQDVDGATEMILGHDWGVRREWLELATTLPTGMPLVAEAGGSIVATGVGTANGAVGWLGTIFVAMPWRGRGLGRAITQALIGELAAAACRTFVLVATAEGRRLYERMGFEVQARYRILEAPGLGANGSGSGIVVRPFDPDDLEAMLAIDSAGTGEDRGPLITRLATPEAARVAVRADGAVEGFVIRAPWGGGATIARSMGAAMALIDARRRTAGPAGRVRVGVLDGNQAGIARLAELGFVEQWSAPRMVRGEALTWQPDWIWGQFNHAVG